MAEKSPSGPTQLSVTTLSQFVRLRNCKRYLRFRLRPDEEEDMRLRWQQTIQPLPPLLKESGKEFEEAVEARMKQGSERVVRIEKNDDYDAVTRWLKKAHEPVILLQVPIKAKLGNYQCSGIADVIRLQRDNSGILDVTIADIKSSRKERMEHQLQVATYAYLLRQVAESNGVEIGEMKGRIILNTGDDTAPLTIDDEDNVFRLDAYLHVLKRLVLEPDSVVNQVATQPFENVPYHLGTWCDGCFYNALCMYDSAERHDLSLVPHLTAVEKRTLKKRGIQTLEALADLMKLSTNGKYELNVAEDKEKVVQDLSKEWPLGRNLPVLVQRAHRALHRFDKTVRGLPFLLNSGFGTLPNDNEYPGLVKIFIDAQHDYLRDRLYLLSALVSGPCGEQVIVRSTDGIPSEEAERDMLAEWVHGVLVTVAQMADGEKAYLHLYLYDALDQHVLLNGLKRHLDTVASVPGFFDLMTQTPALNQPILSFLSRELATRKNLGTVCTPLHRAIPVGDFQWEDDQYAYYKLFRTRLFDNWQDILSQDNGTIVRKPKSTPNDDPRVLRIESASRFNSQIPLEYAYGAWGHFKNNENKFAPFKAVNQRMLEGFAAHRVRALAHIEGQFKNKAKSLKKESFSLSRLLSQTEGPKPTLARSLEEFLFMEHHTALQNRLQVYALPINQRVETGEALLLRYESTDKNDIHWFRVDFDVPGLDPDLTMKTFRPKEGGWIVLNGPQNKLSANQIKHGGLMMIETLKKNRVGLKTVWLSSTGSKFKYYHKSLKLTKGASYTLDVMADDMNADKQLEALKNAGSNVVYNWIETPPTRREKLAEEVAFATEFADYADGLEQPHMLTPKQREAVTSLPGDRVLLVQGPPGTGKSHTVAWAILCRMLERAQRGEPFRVAVSCTTHNAVLVAMQAVLTKWKQMLKRPEHFVDEVESRGLLIAKLSGDTEGEAWPNELVMIDPYNDKNKLNDYLERPYLIMGATPGYLFNLAKYRGLDNGSVNWTQKPFDLLVIDEASQMSVPEAVLASAFLKDTGALLVVGDHRQMSPIIAHNWEKEEKRTTKAAQPYLSLFEFLMERGFPHISLDQSFRLNYRLAEFLKENIYQQDNIPLFSERKDRLPACPPVSAYVDAVLDPDYPIVFVEHDEITSQQFNELELELVRPLVKACQEHLQLDGKDGLGVVVPHRAQRRLLQDDFPQLADCEAIDTVERFQGGERDVIIVSATASDPDFVLAEATFLLNSNRLNVAISRPRKKLVVIASRSVTGLLVSDLETFEHALVWKHLYHQCTQEELWEGQMQDQQMRSHTVRVRGCRA